ncbi:MAG: lipoyl(octanoyl) transferase LipB [Vicingaceae bacterium]
MIEGVEFEYLKERSYAKILDLQEGVFNQLIAEKKGREFSSSPMKVFMCQHNHVYTLGKNGDESNILPLAKESGAEYFHTTRGGDITYHGPGQLVVYPILDLDRFGIGLAEYIEKLEEVIVLVLKEYGIEGKRLEKASGVWLDVNEPDKTRKICAIGIRSSRFVTMHGLAFNVNTDLKYFDYINPCGFQDKGVTSMEKELGGKQYFMHIMERFYNIFRTVFELNDALLVIPLERDDE